MCTYLRPSRKSLFFVRPNPTGSAKSRASSLRGNRKKKILLPTELLTCTFRNGDGGVYVPPNQWRYSMLRIHASLSLNLYIDHSCYFRVLFFYTMTWGLVTPMNDNVTCRKRDVVSLQMKRLTDKSISLSVRWVLYPLHRSIPHMHRYTHIPNDKKYSCMLPLLSSVSRPPCSHDALKPTPTSQWRHTSDSSKFRLVYTQHNEQINTVIYSYMKRSDRWPHYFPAVCVF